MKVSVVVPGPEVLVRVRQIGYDKRQVLLEDLVLGIDIHIVGGLGDRPVTVLVRARSTEHGAARRRFRVTLP